MNPSAANRASGRRAIPADALSAHDPALRQNSIVATPAPWRAGASLDRSLFHGARRRAMLEGCKWDAQVGDIETLAPFPLFLRPAAWNSLAAWAEALAAETLAAENEILDRPELLGSLGLAGAIRRALSGKAPPTVSAVRVMRFDFHFTTDGWRISEVNSDVPGGFAEASFFTALMAQYYPEGRPAGDPLASWHEALARAVGGKGRIALLSAPGFMEDHQVLAFLQRSLTAHGISAGLASPEQLRWHGNQASIQSAWHEGALDAVIRFYQGEWLARLPRACSWPHFFRGGSTPVSNPGAALISESKRFPLLFDRLSTAMPVWRQLLPETRDPRDAPWRADDSWLLKSAFCNTGDTVSAPDLIKAEDWSRAVRSARWCPSSWVAQRRFQSVPVFTPAGPRHVCLGVYTINGRACGIYARMADKPLINFAAVDLAVLLYEDAGRNL